jgi:hypothetical protein
MNVSVLLGWKPRSETRLNELIHIIKSSLLVMFGMRSNDVILLKTQCYSVPNLVGMASKRIEDCKQAVLLGWYLSEQPPREICEILLVSERTTLLVRTLPLKIAFSVF